MGWLILVAIMMLFAAAAFAAPPRDRAADRERRRQRRREGTSKDEVPGSQREMDEIIQNDQLEALKRYGTTADAERLREAGIDLEALGYRPPAGD